MTRAGATQARHPLGTPWPGRARRRPSDGRDVLVQPTPARPHGYRVARLIVEIGQARLQRLGDQRFQEFVAMLDELVALHEQTLD
jgi:hypothetical protein